ncbi:unnamed protein product, partial [marine sediment metagenome]
TKMIEALLESLSGEHSKRFNILLRNMEDDKFVMFYKDLIKYVAPIKTHNINEQTEPTTIVFENVSKEKK